MSDQIKATNINAYPCVGRALSLCGTSLSLAILSFMIGVNVGAGWAIFFIIGIILSILVVISTVYCIFKLNSKIYVSDKEISQKQFTRTVAFKYEYITGVTLTHSPLVKAPPLVSIFCGNDKISFETTSRIYKAFRDCCNNESIIESLKTALKQHMIYN